MLDGLVIGWLGTLTGLNGLQQAIDKCQGREMFTRFFLRDPALALFVLVVVAPPVETLLLQTLPIELLRVLRAPRIGQLLAGTVPFAALHFIGGVASGIAAGVVGGLFFSHTYLECRPRSWWTATWVTAVTHCLHNLIVLPVALALA